MEDSSNTIMLEIENIYSRNDKNKDIFDKCLGEQPHTLSIYKRYMNGEVPEYKYVSDDFNNDDLSRTVYEVECTYRFLREVFDIKIALEDVAKVSCSIYKDYYEGEKEILLECIADYRQILKLLKKESSSNPLPTLETILSNAIINLFPSINNKEVLEQISKYVISIACK